MWTCIRHANRGLRMTSGNRTQAARLGGKHLYTLNLQMGPKVIIGKWKQRLLFGFGRLFGCLVDLGIVFSETESHCVAGLATKSHVPGSWVCPHVRLLFNSVPNFNIFVVACLKLVKTYTPQVCVLNLSGASPNITPLPVRTDRFSHLSPVIPRPGLMLQLTVHI